MFKVGDYFVYNGLHKHLHGEIAVVTRKDERVPGLCSARFEGKAQHPVGEEFAIFESGGMIPFQSTPTWEV